MSAWEGSKWQEQKEANDFNKRLDKKDDSRNFNTIHVSSLKVETGIEQQLNELKSIVLESEDKAELYKSEITLSEIISRCHKSIHLSDTTIEQSEYKGYLNLANSLIGICRERQKEVGDAANRINYNFRMAAKLMLENRTYNEIFNQARLTRREVKEQKNYFKSNKLQ